MNWRVKMKIDQLLAEIIHNQKSLNHHPSEIFLGRYMLDELRSQVNDMVTIKTDSNKIEFMGVKITESYEYPFFIGIN